MMAIAALTLFLLYHITAGWVYYKYISEKELNRHKGQKDIKEIYRFFRFYQIVIVLLWPILLFIGIFQKLHRVIIT